MWVWYYWDEAEDCFKVIKARWGDAHLVYNESCMMIPGTYAQMRADYD